MIHIGTKQIKTKRLTLRRFVFNDADAMYNNWCSDGRVTRFLTWQPHKNIESTRSLLKIWVDDYNNLSTYRWLIEYENKAIGSIDVVRMSDRDEVAEIGYCIGYDYWNKGIMTEAVNAVIDYVFREVQVNKVCISHAVKNPASGLVAKKCGLTLEGIKRQDFKAMDGEFHDIAIYSILKDEWNRKKREC